MTAVATAQKLKRRKRRRAGGASRPPSPWWGDGQAPHLRWAGVTIELPAVWVPLKGVRRVELEDDDGRPRVAWLRGDGTEVASWWAEAGGRWESPDRRYYFDLQAADRACAFFPAFLRHHIGEFVGQPFELRADQAKLIVRPLFGWKAVADERRRFRKVFIFAPKGWGKSPLGAGLGLLLARCDNEAAAEVYAVAADKNNARTVHDNAKIMVEDDEDLGENAMILKDSIYWSDTRSTYKVLSSDASTKHGFRPHAVIFDEFHAQKNRDLYEALKKSMVKRRQPVMVMITHAGDDDEGICYEEYEYAKGVLSGTNPDETELPVIFEALPDEDWTLEATWKRVNPGYGNTVQPTAISAECDEAKAEPRKLNDFLRFHLNRWVNQAIAWIPIDWWDACNEPVPSVEQLREFPCAVGIDMAQKIDLASAVLGFRLPLEQHEPVSSVELVNENEDTGEVVKRTLSLDFRVALIPAFWLPEDTLRERVKQDRVPYDQWQAKGLLNTVDGAIISADPIVRHLVGSDGKSGEVARFPRLKSAQFAYDPAFATEIALALRDRYGLTTVEVLQNYKHLSEACQVFEALVKAKRILHGGHRLLRWNLENVAIRRDDAGRIRPVKPKKAIKRIDGIVATIMAISRLMLMPPEKKKKSRGARVWTPEGWKPLVPERPGSGAPA